MAHRGQLAHALEVVIDHLPVGVLVFDDEQRCIYANARWREIVADAPIVAAEDGGWTEPIFVGERHRALAACQEAIRRGHETSAEFRVRSRDGAVVWLVGQFTPMRDGRESGAAVVATVTDVTALKETERRFAQAAERDGLTGLLTRDPFYRELHHLVEAARRYGRMGSLMMIDVDGLKRTNDRDGHAAGDALLAAFGGILKRRIRITDIAARVGGDEFSVLLPETSTEGAERVARALLDEFSSTSRSERRTASIGIAEVLPGGSVQAITRDADLAMYAAKQRGPGSIARAGADTGHPPTSSAPDGGDRAGAGV